MLIFRWLATLLLLASAVSFAFYLGTVPAQLGPVRPPDDCMIWRHAYRVREATRDAKQP